MWCDVSIAVARGRVQARQRHAIHTDADRLDADWELWASRAQPLGICPTITVDTTEPVDVARLAARL